MFDRHVHVPVPFLPSSRLLRPAAFLLDAEVFEGLVVFLVPASASTGRRTRAGGRAFRRWSGEAVRKGGNEAVCGAARSRHGTRTRSLGSHTPALPCLLLRALVVIDRFAAFLPCAFWSFSLCCSHLVHPTQRALRAGHLARALPSFLLLLSSCVARRRARTAACSVPLPLCRARDGALRRHRISR